LKTKIQEIALGTGPSVNWTDEDLVEACLRGDERAWAGLISKYKKLVYSVPMKYRMDPEDASDIFQAVWLELFSELRNLRHAGALRSWLVTVALNKCFHWKRKRQREVTGAVETFDANIADPANPVYKLKEELEREQCLREATSRLPARCQTMIQLLFYNDPPLPYAEVAKRLGLAEGSIGFIRGRCLKKLRSALEEIGF
jgi:RNA polymerase sigma factor (sigma-70 family)